MELEEKQAQECRQTGEEAPDAGGQEDFEELIRGKYKEFFDRRVKKILDGRLRAMRQENMRLREQQQRQKEEAAERLCRLREQEGEVRRVHPEFNWQEELKNPLFGQLVLAGAEAMAAYETVHRQEMLEQAMRYAASRTRKQVAGSVMSGMGRVAENGGRSIAVTGSDPSKLTSKELADIRRRVRDGEKIRV